MDSLYYCTKCGKPLHVYKKIPNDKSCICCCQIHEKLPIPNKYVKYLYDGILPVFNDELEEEFVNEVLKNTQNFDETLSWFKRKDELVQKFSDDWKSIKASQQQATCIPKCPYCKSINTKKISNMSKAIDTLLFGVFSISRNSKEWHCNNCDSDF